MLKLKENRSKRTQTFLTFTVYVFSGAGIFNPLSKSENIYISLLFSLASSAVTFLLMLKIVNKAGGESGHIYSNRKVLSLLLTGVCVFALLVHLTEVIKDTSHIANRGVSLIYYTAVSICVLAVSLYLCVSSEKGIYRFLLLSSVPFLIMLLASFIPFITVKNVIIEFEKSSSAIISSAKTGIKSGIFFMCDAVFYILFFKECNKKTQQKNSALTAGYITACFVIFICSAVPFLIFGSRIANKLPTPDYSTLRLIYGIDITELVTFVRIVSFLIKSSVYLNVCANLITACFVRLAKRRNAVITTLHLLLPVTFLTVAAYDKTPVYGAFQHLIFPALCILSALLLIIILLNKKTHNR